MLLRSKAKAEGFCWEECGEDDLVKKCQNKTLEILNHPSSSLILDWIAKADLESAKAMMETWDNGSEKGERFAGEFAFHFIELIPKVDERREELFNSLSDDRIRQVYLATYHDLSMPPGVHLVDASRYLSCDEFNALLAKEVQHRPPGWPGPPPQPRSQWKLVLGSCDMIFITFNLHRATRKGPELLGLGPALCGPGTRGSQDGVCLRCFFTILLW